MASDSDVRSVTNTLTSTTADTVTLDQPWPAVEITNHDATNALYVRWDGTTAVAEANGCSVVLPGNTKVVKGEVAEGTRTIVLSVVGDGNKYTVEGVA